MDVKISLLLVVDLVRAGVLELGVVSGEALDVDLNVEEVSLGVNFC